MMWYYKFELQNGTIETQKNILERCVSAEPKHGEKWQAISIIKCCGEFSPAIMKKMVVALEKEEKAVVNKN